MAEISFGLKTLLTQRQLGGAMTQSDPTAATPPRTQPGKAANSALLKPSLSRAN
jgi:hypothetical protein